MTDKKTEELKDGDLDNVTGGIWSSGHGTNKTGGKGGNKTPPKGGGGGKGGGSDTKKPMEWVHEDE